MPLDDLEGSFRTPTTTNIETQFKRDIRVHAPGVSTDDGTLADIDAKTEASMLAPIYYNSQLAGNAAASLGDMSLTQLRNLATQVLGLPDLLPATGSSGYGLVQATLSGGAIANGATCTDPLTNNQYQAVTSTGNTQTYQDGAPLLIVSVPSQTGPQTNCAAGTVLTWDNPQTGIYPKIIVQGDSNGNGLSGGSPQETQTQLLNRIQQAYADPPQGGNDATVRAAARSTKGIGIEQVWTYPAIWMTGTDGFVFTLIPQTLADGVTPIPSTRIPNGAQMSTVLAQVEGILPGDDCTIACSLVAMPQPIALAIVWNSSASGWTDANPWPRWAPLQPVAVIAATSPLAFTIDCSGITVSGNPQTAPAAGMHVAFFNKSTNAFVQKTILTATLVTGSQYAIVCDPTFGASDTVYTPTVGDWLCPMSPSLQLLVPLAYTAIAGLGPSEQVSNPFDAGVRWKRIPESPGAWPSLIGSKFLNPFTEDASIDNANCLYPVTPYQTPIGIRAVSSNLLVEGGVYAFAQ